MIRCLAYLSCLLLSVSDLSAQVKKEPPPTPLVLTAAKPPLPSLRFTLLPELREQTPGNGAPLYRKAGELVDKIPAAQAERSSLHELMSKWVKLPLAEMPREEMARTLAIYQEPLDLLHRATRSETCDFEIAQRQREKGVSALFSDIHQIRTASVVLGVKLRLELAEDRPDQALRTLQIAYALGRHVGAEPTLIASLVGIAITSQANQALELVLSHPNTLNLSWSLLALPRPFLSMRRSLEGERLWIYGTFPGLLDVANNPDAGALPSEKIEKWLANLAVLELRTEVNLLDKTLLAVQVRARHEAAKKALIAAGRSADKIESWPHMQVAIMHSLLEYDQLFDEVLLWQGLPYWQAANHHEVLEKKLRAARTRGTDSPAISLVPRLLPAAQNVILARERLERQFAALRLIEGIRLYAANHEGKLPPNLADIKEVPVPVCPLTGKSFEYRLEDGHAFLSAPPAPKAAESRIQPLRYDISLRSLKGS